MSRPSCTEQRGQALVELVLAAAMLLPLFLLLYQATRFVYARLELISLTRETAMFLIHENKSALPRDLLLELAKRTRLDPDDLSGKVEAAVFGSEFSEVPVLGQMGKLATQFLLGSKLTLEYRLRFGGALGRLAPDGVLLQESATFQSGTWKNLGMKELCKMLFSLE